MDRSWRLVAIAGCACALFLVGCDQANTDVGPTFLSSSSTSTSRGAGETTTQTTTAADGSTSATSTGVDPGTDPSTTSAGDAGTGGTSSTSSTSSIMLEPRSPAGDAQFLMHASFGPTRASLDELQSTDHEAWIKQQMALPATLLRSRYRQRANPAAKEEKQPGVPRTPCEKGSRWQQVTLSHDDIGKPIAVTSSKIFVSGSFRTDLDSNHALNGLSAPQSCGSVPKSNWANVGKSCSSEVSKWRCRNNVDWTAEKLCQQECFDLGYGYDGDDCSQGWPALDTLNFDGYVCSVEPAAMVGSQVTLSTSQACNNIVVMLNPGIHVLGLLATSASFSSVRSGVITLSQPPVPCDFGDFIKVNNLAYRYDSRLKLVDVQAPSEETCVAVPKTQLNVDQCAVQAGRVCNVAQATSATLILNTSSLELISTQTSSYVYSVSGLQADTGPCGTLSRWKQLDCGAVDCTPSSLDSADLALIVGALGQKQGEYRDIFVTCATNVASGSVVSVSGVAFGHSHVQEGSVFDFSTWVSEHPGGAAAITKWASSGYQLVYPASHPMSRFESALADKKLHYVGTLGEEIRYLSLPTTLQSETLALALAPQSSEDFSLACPSPGESSNKPELGNNMPFFMFFEGFSNAEVDLDIDHPSKDYDAKSRYARTNAWINQAITAPDQLRQRVAWALSQILTVGTGGFTYFFQFEMWVNYYDILVRGAFGNYLDLLREVTLSPLMGEYLSFFRNSAFDHDQNYPDENYAREVMQLFTVGTVKLNPDGSEVLVGGSPVPTYDNEDIMTFASVLTGFDRQLMRSNLEVVKGSTGRNIIDPMQMKADWHDAYPKMDLDGNYLGDGYPLCEDLPQDAFLSSGARFEFLSSHYGSNDALILDSASPLYQALCSPDGSGACSFQASVLLSQDLSCHGDECDATLPNAVKVGAAYYEFVPPACVHLYFHNGKIATDGGDKRDFSSKIMCTNPGTFAGGSYCCDGCTNIRPPSWVPDKFCENQSSSSFPSKCINANVWLNNKYCEQRCFEEGYGYGRECTQAYREGHKCGFYQEKVSYAKAVSYCNSLGLQICDRQTGLTTCGYNDDDARIWTQVNCSINVSVDDAGKVTSQKDEDTKMNKIRVSWVDSLQPDVTACPAECSSAATSCVCPISVELQAAFDRVPTVQELQQLKIGAFAPTGACASCGDVKAYHAGVIDEATIFEYQGKYYKNVQSLVHVAGKSFRNPPLFGFTETPSSRSSMWEVESMLEHLVSHPNTPPFIALRLIQRLVSSNPSSGYLSAVAEAFRTGAYGDETFSGRYGDLAAAVAAVLLHPEAQASIDTRGALREPLVKIVHFLRAMEFVDAAGRELLFQELQDLLGQAPFMSPSVFNFYRPDFQPSGLGGLVAPEAQIFEGSTVVNFINGMLSLIKHGGVTACDGGFGLETDACNQSSFTKTWGSSSSPTDPTGILEELNLLLTGGRLTNHSQQVAEAAFQKEGVQAMQEAIVLAPEFNALGDPKPQGPRSSSATTATPHVPASYKALINLYLGGGADTFNLVVPIDCALNSEYQSVRKSAAMPNANLLEVSTSGQTCSKFGVHYKLPALHALYQEGRAAFISNVGSLVEPMDKNDYFKGSKATCAGLFSHSDQAEAAQTLKCQVRGSGPRGVGGRMADSLSQTQGLSTMSFSLKGRQTWSQGNYVGQVGVPITGEVPTLLNYTGKRELLKELTQQELGNIYCEEYAKSAGALVDSNQELYDQLANVTLMTTWSIPDGTAGKLMQTMEAVAKLIVTRNERQVERDFFYVELAGFDTHNEIHEVMDENFDYLNIALEAFVAEMKAQGLFDAVTMVSSSDFGRTLTSNGKGTDHGWAGNHFVLGGAVRGGKVLNDYPDSLLEGNNQDVGRGRLIPKYPWESILFPVSEWMGVNAADHNTIFPNLANFNSSYILSTSSLFD
ncbi:unnamed protein product [Symbiodinium natans]|uniref:DUF1501 domain-containing protein n=1 Tax=Symbiodinium natans TaxID=878477 RepID=A0A812J837_9DINO|nr:unnamed protein product [Symbiodinium natans]